MLDRLIEVEEMKDTTARSKIGSSTQIIQPVDRVAARVVNTESRFTMAIAFDTDDMPAGEDLAKGIDLIPEGTYHCQVDEVDEHESDGYVELKCQIVALGKLTGRVFKHRVYFTGSDVDKAKTSRRIALQTAIRLGLTTIEAFDADKAAGKPHEVEWSNAPSAQFVGVFKHRKWENKSNGKSGVSSDCNIYDIHDDKRRGEANCDPDLLVLVEGLKADDPFGNPAAAGVAPQQPAPVTAVAQPVTANGAAKSPSVYDDI